MDPVAQLRSLQDQVIGLAELVDQMQAALTGLFCSNPADGEGLVNLAKEAATKSLAIRSDAQQAFAAAGVSTEWADKAMLLASLDAAREAVAAKQTSIALAQLRQLADRLDAGKVNHHLSRVRERLNTLRHEAVEELRGAVGPATQPLPGPIDAEDWLTWFWAAGDAAEQVVDDLRRRFTSLAAFLESVTREQWEAGVTSSVGVTAPRVARDEVSAGASTEPANPSRGLPSEPENATATVAISLGSSPEPPGLAASLDPVDSEEEEIPSTSEVSSEITPSRRAGGSARSALPGTGSTSHAGR